MVPMHVRRPPVPLLHFGVFARATSGRMVRSNRRRTKPIRRPTTSHQVVRAENAWKGFLWWQAQDRKALKRINALLVEIQRNGNDGIGKPGALQHNFAAYWSRRVTDEHRHGYEVIGQEVRIGARR